MNVGTYNKRKKQKLYLIFLSLDINKLYFMYMGELAKRAVEP